MELYNIYSRGSDQIKLSGYANSFKAFIEINKNNLSDVDLQNTDLSHLNLNGANFNNSNLQGANLATSFLGNANLKGANLTKANLEGSYLKDSNLKSAIFENANLEDCYLRCMDLKYVNFKGANLKGAILNGVILKNTDFTNANLDDIKSDYLILPIYHVYEFEIFNDNLQYIKIEDFLLKIGCKVKSIKEWDIWFSSDEEYFTKRNTEKFKRIHESYLAYRKYLENKIGELK